MQATHGMAFATSAASSPDVAGKKAMMAPPAR
jgi:hypothetical protein